MDNTLCFKIENVDLYLEKVLVDYAEIPIFFLCKGGEQYYLVLCTDMDELNYIVVKLSMDDVYMLLNGNVPMRDIILKQEERWSIISGEEISLDKVEKLKTSDLDMDLLPKEGACFEIVTKKLKNYVDGFNNEYLIKRNNMYYSFQKKNKKYSLHNLLDYKIEVHNVPNFRYQKDGMFTIVSKMDIPEKRKEESRIIIEQDDSLLYAI